MSLTLLNCVSWAAVLLVDTSRSEPERQWHVSPGAVWPQRFVASVRSFLPAVVPLTTTPGNPLTTRITQIFPGTGQQGICFSFHMLRLLVLDVSKLLLSSPCRGF